MYILKVVWYKKPKHGLDWETPNTDICFMLRQPYTPVSQKNQKRLLKSYHVFCLCPQRPVQNPPEKIV